MTTRTTSDAETSADVRARREAVDVIGQAGRGRDRDEVRELLGRELAHAA